MESQPQNPEFQINPENFHPYIHRTQVSSNGWHPLLLSSLFFITQDEGARLVGMTMGYIRQTRNCHLREAYM